MRLKSGSKFILRDDVLSGISAFDHKMCTMADVRSLIGLKRIFSVGDVTTENLHSNGIRPFMEIVDLKTRRGSEGSFSHLEGSYTVSNEPGTLSHDLFILIKELMNSGGRIEINGEEDLAVIPIIYYSDLNTLVVYGIPGKGMACISVDRSIKENIVELIERIANGRIED